MEWSAPYVVFRINASSKLEQVYLAQDIKQAKYWMGYIAQPGDVLCKTPAHPRHSKKGNAPEYWSHKEATGTLSNEEARWREHAATLGCTEGFPEEQI